jgi:hypothetical protein
MAVPPNDSTEMTIEGALIEPDLAYRLNASVITGVGTFRDYRSSQ